MTDLTAQKTKIQFQIKCNKDLHTHFLMKIHCYFLAPPTRSHQRQHQKQVVRLSEVGALLAQQAGDLPPPGLWQTLHLVGRPLPRRPSLLLQAAAVRLLHAGHNGCVKHVLQVLLGQRRALGEADGAQLLRQLPALLGADWPLLVLGQVNQHLDVLPLVQLGAHEDQRGAGTVLLDLGEPPADQVAEGAGSDHAVAEEEDVCAPVAQRAKTLQLVLRGDANTEDSASEAQSELQIGNGEKKQQDRMQEPTGGT